MNFSINRSEFANALSVVMKGVSNRSTLPVLSGILLSVEEDTLTLQSTDLELSIKYQVPVLMEEPGSTVVPGKLSSDIVKNLPDAAVHVTSEGDTVQLICDNSSFSIKTLNPEDFPAFPVVDIDQQVEIPFEQFSSMVKKVARVVSKDESRAILTGVLITLEGDLLRMVATDSYRLAMVDHKNELITDVPFQVVISGTFLLDVASLSRKGESVSIGVAENQIVITCGDTVFINRRIEGNFPNYRQLLPESFETRAIIDVPTLTSGVKRAALLGASTSPVRFDLNKDSQTIQLSATALDVGSAQEVFPATIEGEDMEIAFNHSYVVDGLNSMGCEQTSMELQSPLKPGIFRSIGLDNPYLYLIMPIRI